MRVMRARVRVMRVMRVMRARRVMKNEKYYNN